MILLFRIFEKEETHHASVATGSMIITVIDLV